MGWAMLSLNAPQKLRVGLCIHVQGPVVQKVDNAIHRINHYPLDNAIGFPNTYLPDSNFSTG